MDHSGDSRAAPRGCSSFGVTNLKSAQSGGRMFTSSQVQLPRSRLGKAKISPRLGCLAESAWNGEIRRKVIDSNLSRKGVKLQQGAMGTQ